MEKKGFFASLFDVSFTEFVTSRVVPVLYVMAIIGSAIAGGVIIVGGLGSGARVAGILCLIVGPLAFFVNVLIARIWLEVIIVVFRIAENTSRLVEQMEGRAATEEGHPSAP